MPQVSSKVDYNHLQNDDYLSYRCFIGGADFSTTPLELTFPAGSARIISPDPGIAIKDDDINEVEQVFALFLEVVDAIDRRRVNLQSGYFASFGRIIDDDRKGTLLDKNGTK